MSRLRADALVGASLPVLLVAGLLTWQRDEMCTVAGCGAARVTAWNGSPGWALTLLAAIAVAGVWVLLLPTRPVPTWVATLTAAVATLGAAVVVASLDAVVFGREGFFRFTLPVVQEFPVLSVRPGIGLPLGLLGLVLQAVGGWATVRARGALVTPVAPAGAARYRRRLAARWGGPRGREAPPTPARRSRRHRG